MKTELCERLGIEYPILSVGFGAGAGPELVAAVSNAGAFGVLGGGAGYPLPYLREQIQRGASADSEAVWCQRHPRTD